MAGLTDSGYAAYTSTELLALVNGVFTSTFGSIVTPSLSTTTDENPTTIIGAFSQQLTDYSIIFQNNVVYLYAQVYNLDLAGGIFLDGLGAWQQITRTAATYSTAICTLTGTAGTVIPAGSLALNSDNDVFELLSTDYPDGVTIPSGGSIADIVFTAQDSGEIDYTTVNRISSVVSGWSSITANSGAIGAAEQTDSEYRNTIKYTQGLNSTGSADSIKAQLNDNANVNQYYVQENDTNEDTYYDEPIGVTVAAHGIYVSVYYDGTTANAEQIVAGIIYNKKSAGCAMSGNTTIDYAPSSTYVSNGGYNPDGYTVSITFTLPYDRYIYLAIDVLSSTTYSSDIVTLIQTACVTNWDDGYSTTVPAVNMGVTVLASRFNPSLAALGVYNIISINLGPSCEYATTTTISSLSGTVTDSTTYTFDTIPLIAGYYFVALTNQGGTGTGDNNANNGIYLLVLTTDGMNLDYSYTRATDANLVALLNGYQTYIANASGTVSAGQLYSIAATGTGSSFSTVTFSTLTSITQTQLSMPIDQVALLTSTYVSVTES